VTHADARIRSVAGAIAQPFATLLPNASTTGRALGWWKRRYQRV